MYWFLALAALADAFFHEEHVMMHRSQHLSNTSVFFPGDSQYIQATSRWNVYGEPNISVVIEPSTADEVAAAVQYANAVHKPFVAVSRGHGSVDTLASISRGIQIWMHKLRDIVIAENGQTARLGAGLMVQDIIEGLDSHGKAAASGSCACVGLMGSGLGGGHGRLQGLYGLIVDNIIDANVVLWNGTQTRVSNSSHADLFWGLRGAGHNFGIVTDVTYKIHDRPTPTWFWSVLYFNSSSLENLFTVLNRQQEEGIPGEVAMRHPHFVWNHAIDPRNPVINLIFSYAGSAASAKPFFQPFVDIGPINVTSGEASYPEIPSLTGSGLDGTFCAHGLQRMQFAAGVKTFNLTTNRAVFNLFEEQSRAMPAVQGNTSVGFEAYSLGAMKAVPSESTAYPHRGDNYLFTMIVGYPPGSVSDGDVIAWGEQTRKMIHEGQGAESNLTVYVNYAFGNETLESLYGYEPWRLERLRNLKKVYDPLNVFSYYMPISPIN